MFEIEALQDITVKQIEFLFNSNYGVREYELYLYSGGSIDTAGFDVTDSTGWSLLQEGTGVTDANNAFITGLQVTITSGDTQAFYIAALDHQAIKVIDRSGFGTYPAHTNTDLKLSGGYSTAPPDPFGSGYQTRRVAPTYISVYYELGVV